MPELQIPDDDDEVEEQIHYMKIHINRNQKHRKSILADCSKKSRSMPELLSEGLHAILNGDDKEGDD